jgi:hypothetical protein
MKITGRILLAVMAGAFAISWSQTLLAQASQMSIQVQNFDYNGSN